jgi:transcriptional antiterminator RfaH
MNSMKKWYLIKTKPRQETIAIANLENQNYQVYCPFAIINNKNQFLFPGYLFVHLDNESQDWSPIRSTKGVLDFVRFGINFANIPDRVIDLITQNEKNTANKIKNINNFKKGDKVQINDGIFKSCVAIFQSIKSDERVLILLNLLGQEQTIYINKKSLVGL